MTTLLRHCWWVLCPIVEEGRTREHFSDLGEIIYGQCSVVHFKESDNLLYNNSRRYGTAPDPSSHSPSFSNPHSNTRSFSDHNLCKFFRSPFLETRSANHRATKVRGTNLSVSPGRIIGTIHDVSIGTIAEFSGTKTPGVTINVQGSD